MSSHRGNRTVVKLGNILLPKGSVTALPPLQKEIPEQTPWCVMLSVPEAQTWLWAANTMVRRLGRTGGQAPRDGNPIVSAALVQRDTVSGHCPV